MWLVLCTLLPPSHVGSAQDTFGRGGEAWDVSSCLGCKLSTPQELSLWISGVTGHGHRSCEIKNLPISLQEEHKCQEDLQVFICVLCLDKLRQALETDTSSGVLHKARSGEKQKSLSQRSESNLLLVPPQHVLFILISNFGISSCFKPSYNYVLTH